MQVVIPDDAEAFVKEQAVVAGYGEVSAYLLSLVRQDHEMRKLVEPFTTDQRIGKLAIEGIESGPPAPLDMHAIRREVHERAGR